MKQECNVTIASWCGFNKYGFVSSQLTGYNSEHLWRLGGTSGSHYGSLAFKS